MVGGGGAYYYKSFKGGGGEESATPFIRADSRPSKELPGNPGGKQFPNGEKTIYDRLTPDGQQIQAAAFTSPRTCGNVGDPARSGQFARRTHRRSFEKGAAGGRHPATAVIGAGGPQPGPADRGAERKLPPGRNTR